MSWWNRIFLIAAVFLLQSCSGMINSLREESIAVEKEARGVDRVNRSVRSPSSTRSVRGLSANNVKQYAPKYKRQYEDAYGDRVRQRGQRYSLRNVELKRRYKNSDFVDDSIEENSLWKSQGQSNYLFSQNKRRHPGDLVQVLIERMLKREIQYSLWLTLPPEKRRIRKKRKLSSEEGSKKSDAKDNLEQQKDAAAEEAKKSLAKKGSNSGPDFIRMEIVENLDDGIVRMIGQKRVIYQGKPRIIEVVSILKNRDIDKLNNSKSSAFLDMKTQVVQ